MTGDSADPKDSSPTRPDPQPDDETNNTTTDGSSKLPDNKATASTTEDGGEGVAMISKRESVTEESNLEALESKRGEDITNPRGSEHDDGGDEAETEEEEDEDGEEEDDDEDEDEDEEPILKYARLTQHLRAVYRNGDATSSSFVAGDKMVCHNSATQLRRHSKSPFSNASL